MPNYGDRKWRRARYLRYKDGGLCLGCGQRVAPIGTICCMFCAYKRNRRARERYSMDPSKAKRRVRLRAQKFVRENKCYYCGSPLTEEEVRSCFSCLANKGSIHL